ncbi:uncharacterized protein LOC125657479 [Ostrea edulis]|uniref:uncharacterized protein LOC125657479 n=1 Tax=Ostrea edulis TaxID=37623 RepID=UPI0024AF0C91|nr:uncharacterized protein LOC125657479 [Ostrea edulis]
MFPRLVLSEPHHQQSQDMPAREPITGCLYHGDRVQFHVLTKGLKENRVIPKAYLTRLASAVCSCRRHKTDIHLLMTTEDLCHMTNHLRDVKLPNMTTSLRNYLHSIIKATHSLEQYGEVKLLYVVYNALVNNAFDELTYNAINSRPKQIPTTKNTTAVTKHRRMTKKQFICMKNKKLSKKDNVRKVILPMYARNMRKFTESKEYKSVKENYGNAKFFLWCCDEENTNFINSNQKKTSVKLYMKDERVSLFEAVRKELMQIAAKLQADLDREREKLKQLRRAYRLQREDCYHDSEPVFETFTDIALQVKVSSKAEYEKRTIKKRAKKSSALTGGHCMNCSALFLDIHTDDSVCRHHPGYLLYTKQVWSCCNAKCSERRADHTLHKNTGCSTAQHNWRRHKKHQPKLSKELLDDSEKTV